MAMHYPKLKFKIVPLNKEVWAFKYFLKHRLDFFRNRFLKAYPILKKKDLDIKEWLRSEWAKRVEKTTVKQKYYQSKWDEIESQFMTNLSDCLGTTWFKKPKFMHAYLSLCKIFPYDSKNKNFFVPYNDHKKYVFLVASHEITHFLYFKKFKELFTDVSQDKYHGSTIEWVLSELLAPIILNDKRFHKIVPGPHKSNPEFYEQQIYGKTVMTFFENKYTNMIYKDGKSFDDYLHWAYNFAKKHDKKLLF